MIINLEYVIYRALYDTTKLYIRPLNMFLSMTDKEKYPSVKQEYRFELIEDYSNNYVE